MPIRHALNLKEHCLICLRHQDTGWIQSLLLINTIDNFQPLVCYLIGAPHNEHHVAPKCKSQFPVPKLKNCPPLCAECYHLLSELNRLHRQLTELQKKIQRQTQLVRNVVKRTIHVPNWEKEKSNRETFDEDEEEEEDEQDVAMRKETLLDTFLRNIQGSGMPEAQKVLVSNFIKGFHLQVIQNESTLVQFPLFPSGPVAPPTPASRPPPPPPPQPKPVPTSTQKASTTRPRPRPSNHRGNVVKGLTTHVKVKSARVSAPISSSNFVSVNDVKKTQSDTDSADDANDDCNSNDPLATGDGGDGDDTVTVKSEIMDEPKLEPLSDEDNPQHEDSDFNMEVDLDQGDREMTQEGLLLEQTESNLFGPGQDLFSSLSAPAAGQKLLCEVCDMEFSGIQEWQQHQKTHETQAQAPPPAPPSLDSTMSDKCPSASKQPLEYPCDICHKTFDLMSKLKSHKFCAHSNEPQFKCKTCGKEFLNEGVLEKHVQILHNSGNDKDKLGVEESKSKTEKGSRSKEKGKEIKASGRGRGRPRKC